MDFVLLIILVDSASCRISSTAINEIHNSDYIAIARNDQSQIYNGVCPGKFIESCVEISSTPTPFQSVSVSRPCPPECPPRHHCPPQGAAPADQALSGWVWLAPPPEMIGIQ